ncbi:MAG: DbpA RNA binding domain-containing protein, partial [Candidatus Competibacteraceae bacterium]|nr:DbpA RNA binding domain-containing protein [Candidatus Competibacteraceae bacterium]
DHLRRESLVLEGLRTLVLDEADEMLRMGFIEDVDWILEHTPPQRQIALFSATMPEPIRRVAHRHLRDPREVKIQTSTATVTSVRQRYWQVSGLHKLDALTRILEVEDVDAVLVFVRTKVAATELAERLEARGHACAALQGDMSQALRERTIEQLKNNGLDIVVATDVAARGLDVARISHVINYDIPYDTEAYIHRIGRTGRAGRSGNAILFVAPREMRMLRAIEKATRQPIESMPLPTRKVIAAHRLAQFKQQILDVLAAEDLDFFHGVVAQLEKEQEISPNDIAAALTYLAQRDRPLRVEETADPAEAANARVRSEAEGPARSDKPRKRSRESADADLVRYRLEVGHQHGATPQNIVGAIANEAGIESRYIGRIQIHDDYSTVDLPDGMPAEIFQHLKRVRVRQCMLNISRLDASESGRRRPASRLSGSQEKPFREGQGKPAERRFRKRGADHHQNS